MDEYEVGRADTCARYGEKSTNDEQRVHSEMDLVVASHRRLQADIALMRRCYDLAALDASFSATPVLDSNGANFTLLSVTLGTSACDEHLENSTMADGIFDCTELPECEVTCDDLSDANGNDRSDLFSFARTAMCTAQFWFHATVLRMVFTSVIWVFINLFRALVLAGVIRLCWQFLNTGYFTYMATCTAEGEHTYKVDDLAEKVRAMLLRARINGAVLLVLAIATQVPWVLALYQFASGLDSSSLMTSASG